MTSEYDYRPADVEGLPYGRFAVQFGQSHTGDLVHNFGAIRCLEGLLERVDETGFILINDYGSSLPAHSGDFEHQRFSGSTCASVNFALLKSYFADSGKCEWLEPLEQNGHIYSHLLGHRIGADTAQLFTERFGKAAFDWRREPADAARAYLKQGRCDSAATAYGEALAREPRNWALMGLHPSPSSSGLSNGQGSPGPQSHMFFRPLEYPRGQSLHAGPDRRRSQCVSPSHSDQSQ